MDVTGSAAAPAAVDWSSPDPRTAPIPRVAVFGWTIAVGLYLALNELDYLSGLVDYSGSRHPFTGLMGPGAVFSPEGTAGGWRALAERGGDVDTLLGWYLLLDVGFIAAYGVLLLRAFRGARAVALTWCAALLVAADFAEDLAARSHAGATYLFTLVKWVLVLALAAGWLRRFTSAAGAPWRATARRRLAALWYQRFSLVAILPVAILSLLPGSDLLDQFPDVQRRWADSGRSDSLHGLWAVLAMGLVCAALFALGRLRSDRLWRLLSGTAPVWHPMKPTSGEPSDGLPRPRLILWWLGPLVLCVCAFVADRAGAPVLWSHTMVFAGVGLVVAVASRILRAVGWTAGPAYGASPTPGDAADRRYAVAVWQAGDLVATVAIVVGGLGLVRSMTAPVALSILVPERMPPDAAYSSWLLGGVAIALLAWPLLWVTRRLVYSRRIGGLGQTLSPGLPEGAPKPSRRARVIFLLSSTFGLAFLGAWPYPTARLGVIAVCALALLGIVVLVATAVVVDEDGPPPELFQVLRLRHTPVVTLLFAALVAAGFVGQVRDIHAVQGLGPAATPAPRMPLVAATGDATPPQDAVQAWLAAAPERCAVELPGGPLGSGPTIRVRPMLLVAAEGGGIRAAYWTVRSLAAVDGAGPADQPASSGCGRYAGFVSGGASGGAVGLTVTAAAQAAGGSPMREITAMAGPEALTVGGNGLFVRDTVYAATGIPLPVWGSLAGGPEDPAVRWLDRAALMERSWAAQTSLGGTFLAGASGPWQPSPTGRLVLTSTDVQTGCRALVSQVDLGVGDPVTACDAANAVLPYSFDLFAAYGAAAVPAAPGSAGPPTGLGCLLAPSSATAAMLASRFPFVTPSGVVGECGSATERQLVDGGYTENSGLGTLVDLGPHLLDRVRRHNDAALAGTATSPADATVIVPVVVYLDNGVGSDLKLSAGLTKVEALVPSTANKRAGKAQADAPALLTRLQNLVAASALCTTTAGAPATCESLRTRIGEVWPRRVTVAHQRSTLAVGAPLGWVLSAASMTAMDAAVDDQATDTCVPPVANPEDHPVAPDGSATPGLLDSTGARSRVATDAVCQRGYGALGDALRVVEGRSQVPSKAG